MMAVVSTVAQLMVARSTPVLAKKGVGRPDGMLPMMGTPSILMNNEMMVITMRATNVEGTFLVTSGKR